MLRNRKISIIHVDPNEFQNKSNILQEYHYLPKALKGFHPASILSKAKVMKHE